MKSASTQEYDREEKGGSQRHRAPASPHTTGDMKLWGMTLGMTLDLLAFMQVGESKHTGVVPAGFVDGEGLDELVPSMSCVFPRFSYPDVNFWLWVFGRRFREVMRSWEASIKEGGPNSRRINWPGTAINAFYAAVRKALVVVIVLRGLGVLAALGLGIWWLLRD